MIDVRRIGAGESVAVDEKLTIAMAPGFGVGDTADVAVAGCLTNMDKHFALEARGECDISAVCSLCLAPVDVSAKFQIMETFVEEDGGEDDIIFTDKMIDLTPAVQRNLLLNLPMKILCKADCAGLCPKCGHDLNKGACDCEPEINENFRQLLQLFEE